MAKILVITTEKEEIIIDCPFFKKPTVMIDGKPTELIGIKSKHDIKKGKNLVYQFVPSDIKRTYRATCLGTAKSAYVIDKIKFS